MPDKMNYIPVPESMKGQVEPEGTVEVEYTLVNEEGRDYLKIKSVEGQSVEAPEAVDPLSKMKRKIGYREEEENDEMSMG